MVLDASKLSNGIYACEQMKAENVFILAEASDAASPVDHFLAILASFIELL